MASTTKLTTLRTIIRRMKEHNDKAKLSENPAFSYIMTQYRKNAVTGAQYCREQDEKKFLAETYATYLNAMKNYKVLYTEYHKPEISTADAAKRVGFQLPNVPKPAGRP